MINFDPSLGPLVPKGKVESSSPVEKLFSPNILAPPHIPKKASGFEGARHSAVEPELPPQWNSAIAAMNRVNLLGAAWNAVFTIAQGVPETFKKLMNN